MVDAMIFGLPVPDVLYADRRAAYVIIIEEGRVALVKPGQKYFLPGGGSLPGETAEDTVVREVGEELAKGVRLRRKIAEAVQYFYSPADETHYKMLATFFAGEFTGALPAAAAMAENELHWLPIDATREACFHECHAWAVFVGRDESPNRSLTPPPPAAS